MEQSQRQRYVSSSSPDGDTGGEVVYNCSLISALNFCLSMSQSANNATQTLMEEFYEMFERPWSIAILPECGLSECIAQLHLPLYAVSVIRETL